MRGRTEDDWQRNVASKPVDQQLQEIRGRGFRGLTIDRFGYGDNAAALEAALSAMVGPPVAVSADGRMSFFLLR